MYPWQSLLCQGLHITVANFFLRQQWFKTVPNGERAVRVSALSHLVQRHLEAWGPGPPNFSQESSREKHVFLLIAASLTYKFTQQIHSHLAFSESWLTFMKIWGLSETIIRLITYFKSPQIVNHVKISWRRLTITKWKNQDGGVGRHTAPPRKPRTDGKSNGKEVRHQGDKKNEHSSRW